MFRALGRVGVRMVVAVGLVVLVGGIVAIARLAGTPDDGGRFDIGEPSTLSNVDPTSGDDGEVLPTPSNDESRAIEKAAAAFISAWLRRELSPAAWHAGLKPLSTAALAYSLEGVDPEGVPAARTIGQPRVVLRSERYAQVSIAVDTGTLLLSLLSTDGRWLVDAVDWERA